MCLLELIALRLQSSTVHLLRARHCSLFFALGTLSQRRHPAVALRIGAEKYAYTRDWRNFLTSLGEPDTNPPSTGIDPHIVLQDLSSHCLNGLFHFPLLPFLLLLGFHPAALNLDNDSSQ